jgi:riboflavin synthase
MFTGIITDIGKVLDIQGEAEVVLRVGTRYDVPAIAIGASIAHNGICLTVIDKGPDWYSVLASAETLAKTTLGTWTVGRGVNLERALKVGDELGGHIVSGHVDGVARVVAKQRENNSVRFTFETPPALSRYIAPKGSVALDGVSLTVNEVDGDRFGVNIIPQTQTETTFGSLDVGATVNVEIDMLARYVARLQERG